MTSFTLDMYVNHKVKSSPSTHRPQTGASSPCSVLEWEWDLYNSRVGSLVSAGVGVSESDFSKSVWSSGSHV